jgi:hypothetical protein
MSMLAKNLKKLIGRIKDKQQILREYKKKDIDQISHPDPSGQQSHVTENQFSEGEGKWGGSSALPGHYEPQSGRSVLPGQYDPKVRRIENSFASIFGPFCASCKLIMSALVRLNAVQLWIGKNKRLTSHAAPSELFKQDIDTLCSRASPGGLAAELGYQCRRLAW